MLSTFKINDESGNSFTLTTQGKVLDESGALTGAWTTGEGNQIVVQGNADSEGSLPSPVHIPALWRFNEKNQFCLLDGTQTVLVNFNTVGQDLYPNYEVRNARLRIRPAEQGDFEFFIDGDWSLNDQHILTFVANGISSPLNGILADNKSRFTYRFFDKDQPGIANRLTFSGRWEKEVVDGDLHLRFFYTSADGTEKIFELPGKMVVERGTNQFKYVYDKDNRTFGITLLGFLKVSENFEITYIIDAQQSNDGGQLVEKTTFTLQAVFHGNQFEGDLTLALTKNNNEPGNYLLSLTGEYTAVMGQTNVMVGFKFSQVRNGQKVTTKLGFGGSIVWKNGHVFYQLSVNQSQVELMLGMNIKLRNGAAADARLNLKTDNGQVKSVSFLFNVSF
jgi:hypothetical protein